MNGVRLLGRPRRYAVPRLGSTPWALRAATRPRDDHSVSVAIVLVEDAGHGGEGDPVASGVGESVEWSECSTLRGRGANGDECLSCALDDERAPLRLDNGPCDIGVCLRCSRIWAPAGLSRCPHCNSVETAVVSMMCRDCDVFVALSEWGEHARWAVHFCGDAPPRAAA